MAQSRKTKRVRRSVARGIAHVKAMFNNTLVTITDTNGETLCSASAGTMGFKGARKSTPFAAQRAAENCASRAKKMGLVEVEVRVNGPGSGREGAITAYAQYDVDRPGWFGAMRTAEIYRRAKGLGTILFRRCMADMRRLGYEKALIGWVAPLYFYAKVANARVCRTMWLMTKKL